MWGKHCCEGCFAYKGYLILKWKKTHMQHSDFIKLTIKLSIEIFTEWSNKPFWNLKVVIFIVFHSKEKYHNKLFYMKLGWFCLAFSFLFCCFLYFYKWNSLEKKEKLRKHKNIFSVITTHLAYNMVLNPDNFMNPWILHVSILNF